MEKYLLLENFCPFSNQVINIPTQKCIYLDSRGGMMRMKMEKCFKVCRNIERRMISGSAVT